MGISEACTHEWDNAPIAQYETRELGVPLVIFNSVQKNTCRHCGEATQHIPFPERLIAAAAVARIRLPEKLSGAEIRFIRKALTWTAKDMSEHIQVAPETISRWENEKAAMGPGHEKMLRLLAGIHLREKAPAIGCKLDEIANMTIKSIRSDRSEIRMAFELIRFRISDQPTATVEYTEELRAA